MRKLKVIGLSALAVLAVSAVSASAAQAATEGTAVVEGTKGYTATQVAPGHTFTLVGGRVLSCTTATFAGTVTNGDNFVIATPTYTGCTVKVGATTLTATVNMSSCKYKFYDLTTTASMTYAALTDLFCDTETKTEDGTVHIDKNVHEVTIKVYQSGKEHTDANRLCEYTIAPKEGMTGVHFTDNTDGTLNITATNVAVPTKRVFGTVGNCGEAAFNSTYNGDTIATGAGGAALGLDD